MIIKILSVLGNLLIVDDSACKFLTFLYWLMYLGTNLHSTNPFNCMVFEKFFKLHVFQSRNRYMAL